MEYYLLLIQFLLALFLFFILFKSINYFLRLYKYKKLKSTPFPKKYQETLKNLHQYKALSPKLKEKMHLLILLFIDQKEFIGAKMLITDEIKTIIAFYASLLRIGFALGEKDRVNTIIVYPNNFLYDEEYQNGGIYKTETIALEGQSANGTVVLSWQDIKQDISQREKENVIIHEFAHELDFESGYANGTPILESSNYRRWSEVFSTAFDRLKNLSEKDNPLGTYALTNEAEFFAVCSERFFETPKDFKEDFPDIYEQLKLFYRVDTVTILQ